ncbi:actin-domain-containing protein [Tricharina praecox]|uniref:actin-domain-containing protein n=1 Tax=Tricharina praecox TaxID=43433 RepID=UPI002220F7C8|nr:actin-domain-containing protein [Tricharina praecox]KAI5843585.1 actin-domain-containing protein [Tricharina praecox]
MPLFRDEHILIIAPGSQTTLAQLGLPESFTPPKFRFPSRMFPGIDEGTWIFTKVREARDGEKEDLLAQAKGLQSGEDDAEQGDDDDDDDEEEGEAKEGGTPATAGQGADKKDEPAAQEDMDEDMGEDMGDGIYVEDEGDEEGAVWCMKEGRVIDWGCFFALLTYVHEMVNPTFHTPILLVHPPEFTLEDKQLLTQFMFEKLKTPGFALMDSAVTSLWAYGLATSTIIDVGFEKTDVTPVVDFLIQRRARKTVYGCGGETMTKHLCSLLPDMKPEHVEALKKSPICEILPLGTPIPGCKDGETSLGIRMPHIAITKSTVDETDALVSEEDGTVNVAAIVASGKTHEFLAKREQALQGEAERKLPNRDREVSTFWVMDKKLPGEEDETLAPSASALSSPTTTKAPELPSPTTAAAVPEPPQPSAASDSDEVDPEAEKRFQETSKQAQETRARAEGVVLRSDEIWRELSVGHQRFRAAECGILSRIADAVYDSISRVEEVSKRADLWDSLIIVGNGAKLRGFKDALLQSISAKYLIPPSSGTIFSSELPTPTATGASTPMAPGPSAPPASGPNPLLVAATTHHQQVQHHYHPERHSSHGQTPLSIKLAKMPDYFPEWKEAGFDEAAFLGAQVAAKVVFVVDQGANRGFMSRVEYNELGPEGVTDVFM